MSRVRQRRAGHRLSAIDLFCGCGGLSLGLRRAGFAVLGAVDADRLAVDTYRNNHKGTSVLENDIRSVSATQWMKELGLCKGELDLLAGCPPCQGFSKLRTRNGGRGVSDDENDLVFEFVRFVKVFRPRAIMLENVPGLAKDVRLVRVKRTLAALRYRCAVRVLDATAYGVPQRRKRMILLGSRLSAPRFAEPINRQRTVRGAIWRLPQPEDSDDPVHNYVVRRSDAVIERIGQIPRDGGSRGDLPDEKQLDCHRRCDGFKDIYGRMAWRRAAPTVTGGCINPSKGRFVHPIEDRAITLREAALLQGFPRSYRFKMSGGRYAVAQLIGNAFPPKFAEHHARVVREQMMEHRKKNG